MEFFLHPDIRVFSVIAGFIVVLLVFEVALVLIGAGSDLGISGPDGDAGIDVDFDLFEASVGCNDGHGLSAEEIATLDLVAPGQTPRKGAFRRFLDMTGVTSGPLLVWMASIAAGVSTLGFALQGAAGSFADPLPRNVALCIVLIPGVLIGAAITRWVSRLIPAIESESVSVHAYQGIGGTVMEGTATRGKPALVIWKDRFGGSHRTYAEPFRDDDIITAGSEVLMLRTRDMQARIIKI